MVSFTNAWHKLSPIIPIGSCVSIINTTLCLLDITIHATEEIPQPSEKQDTTLGSMVNRLDSAASSKPI